MWLLEEKRFETPAVACCRVLSSKTDAIMQKLLLDRWYWLRSEMITNMNSIYSQEKNREINQHFVLCFY